MEIPIRLTTTAGGSAAVHQEGQFKDSLSFAWLQSGFVSDVEEVHQSLFRAARIDSVLLLASVD